MRSAYRPNTLTSRVLRVLGPIVMFGDAVKRSCGEIGNYGRV